MCLVSQSCPTLCDPMDCSRLLCPWYSPGRVIEWLPFPLPGNLPNPGIETAALMSPALAGGFFATNATWEARLVVSNSAKPWTVAYQAPLSMGFSRQEYWSGLSCPSPGDLPDPGIKPGSLMSPALAGGFFATSTIWKAPGWPGSLHNYCTRNELII